MPTVKKADPSLYWEKEDITGIYARRNESSDIWQVKKYGGNKDRQRFLYLLGPKARVSLPFSYLKKWEFSDDGGKTFQLSLYGLIDLLEKK